MNRFFALLLVLGLFSSSSTATAQAVPDFSTYPTYDGPDLGLTWTNGRATLRVWAPTASALKLRLYATGTGGKATAEYPMKKSDGGTWLFQLPAGAKGFYTVQATIDGKPRAEVADPYVHAVGINGLRGALLDPATAAPPKWAQDQRPPLAAPTDVVIGEIHVRDLSMHPESGMKYKGQYLAFTEAGTRGPGGVTTGLDHLAALGITHAHLLPVNDFASIDETKLQNRYNWGYDPLHYSVPEGSYATNPADPASRIRELRQLVAALHGRGLRVVLDVVYNHTAGADQHPFEQLVPGYYYRQRPDGRRSDASGCGNEVASERPMVRKLIVESVAWWAREYHVDGFRFDLMGILDLETMRAVRAAVDQVDRTIFLYGEGWTAGPSPLSEAQRAVKANVGRLERVAAFGDELRDGVKGHYANHKQAGFASGADGLEESVKFGIVAATRHPQLAYEKINYSKAPWATAPEQAINYVDCHDDLILWDKLAAANPGVSEDDRRRMQLLAATIVFTSQGVPFLPVGDEFLRTKNGVHNSYNQPDAINQLDWGRKAQFPQVVDFYRRLIALRKAHPAFRLPTQELIQRHLEFLPNCPPNTIGYQLKNHAGGDKWQTIVVLFNGDRETAGIPVPPGQYTVVLRGEELKEEGLDTLTVGSELILPPTSAVILVK